MSGKGLEFGVDPAFLPPEGLWQAIEPLLPEEPPKPKGGRPRLPDRSAFFALFYLLCTGIQWKALPRSLGASSTVHDRFQQWVEAGVFEKLWTSGLIEYDVQKGLQWSWQSLDGAMTKAPLGGEETGPNPTDRGKKGVKRHLLTEGNGLPIGLVVTGANRHDKTQVDQVFFTKNVEDAPQLAAGRNRHRWFGVAGFRNRGGEATNRA